MSVSIPAGQLDQPMTLQARSTTADILGDRVAWTDVATIRAAVQTASAAEVVDGQQVRYMPRYRVFVHYMATLTVEHRLIFRDRVLHIESVQDPDMRRRLLELSCVDAGAYVADGSDASSSESGSFDSEGIM